MLAASGTLDDAVGGPSIELDAPENRRRTLYATIHRREMSTTLLTHDFPDPATHSPARTSTTTPLQGLYALNGPLLASQSQALAARLLKECAGDDASRIGHAYWLLYSREPTPREVELGLAYLQSDPDLEPVTAWTQYAHVLLISNDLLYVD
jgi:hypothetical protein